jgi:hypothetical protein
MNVNFEIDTVKILTQVLRKSLSDQKEPALIAVKLSLIKNSIKNMTPIQRLFNKFSIND